MPKPPADVMRSPETGQRATAPAAEPQSDSVRSVLAEQQMANAALLQMERQARTAAEKRAGLLIQRMTDPRLLARSKKGKVQRSSRLNPAVLPQARRGVNQRN
jgi:hypothetical protein